MKFVTSFPRKVREIEHCSIPLKDGTQLAARIWLPEGAEESPVPAIFEYIPYRKGDMTAYVDSLMHPYFAGHGYAALRVDIRGSGESDGILIDEYNPREHEDALEILEWIAAQSWCTGAVGMIGLSWGGITALQIASRQPSQLQAIITVCSTDERYGNDIHYMGGCLLNESMGWGTLFHAQNSRAPDPALVGEGWRDMWLERLENIVLPFELWLRHQRRDSYWKLVSVSERYETIRCPVYAVGGWADGYHDAILRLMRELTGPRKALIGPWQHIYPHYTAPGPGPAINFLDDALRWWDQWLKDIDTGIMDEPMVRVWMQESIAPKPYLEERPGRWVAERSWPSPRIGAKRYTLNLDGLRQETGPEAAIVVRSPQSLGAAGGLWLPEHFGAELSGDQREEDAKSVVFDTEPLTEPLEIMGTPFVTLKLAADRSQGLVVVRLCDVAPDGTSDRVTYGALNLTHRESDEIPEPLGTGHTYEVIVKLKDVAFAFPAGHRLRVAISTAYWPMFWPSPETVSLSLYAGAGSLELPVRQPDLDDEKLRQFGPPVASAPLGRKVIRVPNHDWMVERDLRAEEIKITVMKDDGAFILESTGLEFDHKGVEIYRILDDDPLSASVDMWWRVQYRRADWSVCTATRAFMTSTKDRFLVTANVDAYEGETRVFSRSFDLDIPRDMV